MPSIFSHTIFFLSSSLTPSFCSKYIFSLFIIFSIHFSPFTILPLFPPSFTLHLILLYTLSPPLSLSLQSSRSILLILARLFLAVHSLFFHPLASNLLHHLCLHALSSSLSLFVFSLFFCLLVKQKTLIF